MYIHMKWYTKFISSILSMKTGTQTHCLLAVPPPLSLFLRSPQHTLLAGLSMYILPRYYYYCCHRSSWQHVRCISHICRRGRRPRPTPSEPSQSQHAHRHSTMQMIAMTINVKKPKKYISGWKNKQTCVRAGALVIHTENLVSNRSVGGWWIEERDR